MGKILLFISIFSLGCGTLKDSTPVNIREENRDVLILASLLHAQLRFSQGRYVDLKTVLLNDTLRRITNNFDRIETISRKGYISVYYTFSDRRDNKIQLTNKEREVLDWISWAPMTTSDNYDGEIRLDFGERHYRIKKILVKKNNGH
jgi:hypothetical protein